MGTEPASSERRESGKTVAIIVLGALAGLALLSFAVGVFVLPLAIQQAREARRRQQAVENLRSIELALKSYHQEHARPLKTIEPLSESRIGEIAVGLKDEWLKKHPEVKAHEAAISNVERTADGWDVTFEGVMLARASTDHSDDRLHVHIDLEGKLIRAVWEPREANRED